MKTYLRFVVSFAAIAMLFISSISNAQCPFWFSAEGKEIVLQAKNGASVSKTFYVKSLSDGSSTAQITITGADAAQFTIEPSTLEFTALHQKKEVKLTFTPGANTLRASAEISVGGMGAVCYHGMLIGTIGDNPAEKNYLVIDPMQYNFPQTEIGKENCKDFYIVNKGTTSAWVSGWDLLTEFTSEFMIDPTTTDVKEIKPGEKLAVNVCYTPTQDGIYPSGYLQVNYSFDQETTMAKIKAWFGTKKQNNDTTFNKSCLKQTEAGMDAWRGQVKLDSTGNRVLTVTNPSGSPITITSVKLDGEDAKAFTIDLDFPATVAANSTLEIPFTFTPYANADGSSREKYFAYAIFTLDGGSANICKEFKAMLYGYSIFIHNGDKDPNNNGVGIPIFGNEKTTVGLSNRGVKESYTLLFYNNLDVDLTVKEVYMKGGEYFKVTETSPAATPFVLKPGEEMTVTISYESTDKLIHKDALVIVADKSLDVIEIALEGGDFTALAVKPILPAGVAVFISPNPSQSDVKVDLAGTSSATIEVLDMLGNLVARGVTSGDWVWNGKTIVGSVATNGAYIIRIAGTSISGETFITSKRVILQK